MKKAAFVLALLLSGTAIAQTTGYEADTATDTSATTDMSSGTDMAAQPIMAPASGTTVEPSNANPEKDARGIAVISAPAMVPAGWNGTAGAGMGGPLLDASGEPATESNYPACSATVTDNCLQAYERGRS